MADIGKHVKTKTSEFRDMSIGRRIFAVLWRLAFICVIAIVALIGYTAFKVGKIDQDTLYDNVERSSILYDINDEEIDTLHYTEDRKIVSIDEMPDNLKNAFVAIEDKTFYKHHGFNFKRMLGAVLSKLTGRSDSISGTSTITQQLARNAYLSEIKSQRSIRRKLSEMYIAWRLERRLTKDQILEAYLNTIYLGYGNYGVSSASRTYFSKDTDELDLAECAALAALPQAPDSYALITTEPDDGAEKIENIHYYSLDSVDEEEESDQSYYDTYADNGEESEEDAAFYANDISKERRDLVLDLMAEQGYISQSDVSSASVDIIDILEPSFEKSESAYTYFKDYLAEVVTADLMERYDMSEEEAQRMVYTGGLKIHTTIDSDIQNIIYDEFQNDYNFPNTVDGSKVQASMVVTEIGTGQIRAFVGGRDAGGSQLFNRAISPRQPGSSIKPLAVYGAALQKSYEYAEKGQTFPYTDYGFDTQGTKYWGDYITASSGVIDEPLTINGEKWPENATRSYSGSNSLRSALQQSINTCAVKILWQVGLEYSAEMLEKYKLSTIVTDQNEATNDVNPAALGLGAMTYGVTPLDMSLAYAVFPGGGKLNSAVSYTNVLDSEDRLLLVGKSEETEVIDRGVAWIMTDLLKSVVSKGLGSPASISGIQVGGKTGTTNDTFDIWFDGFTPDYSAALWIGTDLNVEMYGTSSQAAALWGKIMGQIPHVADNDYDEMPSNVVQQRGEYYSLGTEKNPGNFSGNTKKKKSKSSTSDDDEQDREEKPEIIVITPQPGETTDSGSGGSANENANKSKNSKNTDNASSKNNSNSTNNSNNSSNKTDKSKNTDTSTNKGSSSSGKSGSGGSGSGISSGGSGSGGSPGGSNAGGGSGSGSSGGTDGGGNGSGSGSQDSGSGSGGSSGGSEPGGDTGSESGGGAANNADSAVNSQLSE